MANIQETLDALQPYVIGIRYLEKKPLIDAVFKDGWTLPSSDIITRVKGNQDVNYYMLYSEKDGIGLDELLEYVDATIRVNIEREKKHELLKEKVNELKELFKRNTLTNLKRLKFSFAEDDFLPEINDLDLESEPIVEDQPIVVEEPKQETPEVPLTDEEIEILEEERRAENYRQIQEAKKLNGQVKNISSKVELPPKRKILESIGGDGYDTECECGPEEACSKCIDRKGF